ncbi:MAG: hypothetical protein IMZ74_12350 [Actinobacteria bacterium]|nr:hypothetical protein [Actinomycetota bacterium]
MYVGGGLAADYAGLGVKGKIVVVDSSMDNFWFNMQAGPFPKRCPRE